MTKNYRTKQHHLQIICTPEQYPLLYEQASYSTDYQSISPRYLIARCPFCGSAYSSLVDTHTSHSWGRSWGGYSGMYFGKEDDGYCEHYVQVQRFFNLEGIVPVEKAKFGNVWHVPFVMPLYVPEDIPSVAVMHSLPVCRIEDDRGKIYNTDFNRFVDPQTEFLKWDGRAEFLPLKSFADIADEDKEHLATARFVPRYTGFAVTYYALDPKPLIQQYVDKQGDVDWPIIWASMEGIARFHPSGYDLAQWVEKEKLYWLDLDSPDLPLKKGSIESFPYDTDYFDATGSLQGFRYYMGGISKGNY